MDDSGVSLFQETTIFLIVRDWRVTTKFSRIKIELAAGTRVISLSSPLVLALIPGTKGIYPNLQGQLPIFRVHPIYGRQDWNGVDGCV